jgi:hypothetical protein
LDELVKVVDEKLCCIDPFFFGVQVVEASFETG